MSEELFVQLAKALDTLGDLLAQVEDETDPETLLELLTNMEDYADVFDSVLTKAVTAAAAHWFDATV